MAIDEEWVHHIGRMWLSFVFALIVIVIGVIVYLIRG